MGWRWMRLTGRWSTSRGRCGRLSPCPHPGSGQPLPQPCTLEARASPAPQALSPACLLELRESLGSSGHLGRCKGPGEGGISDPKNQGFFQPHSLCLFTCTSSALPGLSSGAEANQTVQMRIEHKLPVQDY